jgi:hypothetical protein
MPIPKHQKVVSKKRPWNILLYADSGWGKTVFALKDKRVLVLAPGAEDDGLESAARMGTEAEQIEVDEWEDMIKANDDLWSDDGIEWLQENFDTLVVDSLTEMDSMIMRYIARMTRDKKLAKDTDPDDPWIDDYGKRNILLERMVRSFNDLPVNVFYTALPRTAEDPDGKEFMVPMLGGNKATDYRFSMKIAALMTSFAYGRMELQKIPSPTEEEPNKVRNVKQRVVYWEDTSFSKGKDRTISLAPKTVNFTMAHMRLCIAGVIDREGKKIVPKSDEKAPVKKAAAPVTKKVAAQPSPPPVKAVESKVEPSTNGDQDADIDIVTTSP